MSRAATTVAHKALPTKARRYAVIRGGASRAAETLDLFRPDEPHPSELLAARPAYKTTWGAMYEGDGAKLLAALPDQSVDLVVTSPPYALQFKKEYGNVDKDGYVEWLRPFGREIHRVLKGSGSFVLNIGGSYNAGAPTRSLYQSDAVRRAGLPPRPRVLLVQPRETAQPGRMGQRPTHAHQGFRRVRVLALEGTDPEGRQPKSPGRVQPRYATAARQGIPREGAAERAQDHEQVHRQRRLDPFKHDRARQQ
jgi:hypothetical protein